jgi:AraC-like DNA-binding protein
MKKIHVLNFRFGLSCGVKILSPFANFHQHHEIELTFFEKTPVQYHIGNVVTELRENELLLFWGSLPHRLAQTELNNAVYYIHIPLNIFFQWQLPDEIFERLLNGEVFKAQCAYHEIAMDKVNFIQWARDMATSNSYIQKAVLLNIESRILRFIAYSPNTFKPMKFFNCKANQDKSSFTKLYEYLIKHYRNNKTIKEIATELRMNPDYASALFRNNSGLNLIDFLNMLKVAESQKLLLTTRMKIVDIAFEVGFGSLSNFNMVFKKFCEVSPTKYRSGIYNQYAF